MLQHCKQKKKRISEARKSGCICWVIRGKLVKYNYQNEFLWNPKCPEINSRLKPCSQTPTTHPFILSSSRNYDYDQLPLNQS